LRDRISCGLEATTYGYKSLALFIYEPVSGTSNVNIEGFLIIGVNMQFAPTVYFVQQDDEGNAFIVDNLGLIPSDIELLALKYAIHETIKNKDTLRPMIEEYKENLNKSACVRQSKQPDDSSCGEVYLVKQGNHYKIGKSKNSRRRVREFANSVTRRIYFDWVYQKQ